MTDEERLQLARREALLKMAATGALGAGGICGLVRDALAADSTQGIRQITGSVTVNGAPAAIGQQIRRGQIVATGPGGELVFVVGKDAFLLHENSKLGFERKLGVSILRFITGKVLSVFGKGHKTLHTPTATIGIRGTACYIEAEAARTYFCLCYGEAEITPHADPASREIVRTQHHDHPLYIGEQQGQLLVPAMVINHTDAELIMLENTVGRVPPFLGEQDSPYP